ncbi:DUF6446 family protein [Tabrizicola thermarum]|uniref:DUF6446 family protein n=1 Tax=Tabrizicola thermarum TaxID=2670345 RepID=UPI001EE3ABAA|nr:DUF6446 family protein [Tabrizicola thermarum]
MNAGKVIVGAIVIVAAVAGGLLWYTAERAFYRDVAFTPGQEIRLVPLTSDQPEPIVVDTIQGIDADSSPIKFRACFTTPLSLAMLTETYRPYEGAEPLVAPRGFDCFDAAAIGRALETGEALAFLSERNIHPGVDRVVAVFGDGRAYAWQQLNGSLAE